MVQATTTMMDKFMKQESLIKWKNPVYIDKVLVKIRHKIINHIILLGMANLVSLFHISSH